MAAVSPDPVSGYGVDETAARLGAFECVLRELVHWSAAWLALESRLEVKYALGDHLQDDARAVGDLRARLEELRWSPDRPGNPGDELAGLLDRGGEAATPDDYLAIAYGELKPTLVAALRDHLDELDPLVDEASLRLLTELVHRQERHVVELGPAGALSASPADVGTLRMGAGPPRELRATAPVPSPARDAYVTIAEEGATAGTPAGAGEPQSRRMHDLMNAALCAAELTARTSHEQPGLPWAFHSDAARVVWDLLRHAQVHERLMASELDSHWGDHPVDLAGFRAISAEDPAGRLALLLGTVEQASRSHAERREALLGGGAPSAWVTGALDHLLADEQRHVGVGLLWGTAMLGGDEAAYRARWREGLGAADPPLASPS